MILILKYCKFRNFCENLFSKIMLKDIFVMVKYARLVHDLPTSVNGGVISPFHKGFISQM